MTLYLYALVDERPAPSVSLGRGMSRKPLTVVGVGRHFAVVEESSAPSLTAAHLVGHDRVVRRLARVFRAVLPMRFGSTASDLRALRALVRPLAAELGSAFERVRDAVQFTLRVRGPRALRSRLAPSGGPGTQWLAARLAARQLPEAACVVDATRSLVREIRVQRASSGIELGKLYQLVAKRDVRVWRRALASALPSLPRGVTITVTGPWPAYAFVEAT